MRLTITNYKRIIGRRHRGNYLCEIEDVQCYSEWYAFTVRDLHTRNTAVAVLKRDGYVDADGDLVFQFYNGKQCTQAVTPGWFENIDNAVSAIVAEYESLTNTYQN